VTGKDPREKDGQEKGEAPVDKKDPVLAIDKGNVKDWG
jgi:hypothetical protein